MSTTSDLMKAAKAGDLSTVRQCLDDGEDVNTLYRGATALHKAAASNRVEVIEELLSRGAQIDNEAKGGRTALHDAAKKGKTKAVKLLIEKGADVQAADRNKETPLHEAGRYSKVPAIKALVAGGADPNYQHPDGSRSVLMSAVVFGKNEKGVTALLKAGADPNRPRGRDGVTPFLSAIRRGKQKVVEAMLEYGADPSSATDEGKTALELAEEGSSLEHQEIANLLRQASGVGADQDGAVRSVKKSKPVRLNSPPLTLPGGMKLTWGPKWIGAINFDRALAIDPDLGEARFDKRVRRQLSNPVDVAFTRGDHLVTGNKKTWVFDVETGKKLQTLAHKSEPLSIIASNTHVVTTTRAPTMLIWEVESGEKVVEVEIAERIWNGTALSEDGKSLLLLVEDEAILFDVHTGEERARRTFKEKPDADEIVDGAPSEVMKKALRRPVELFFHDNVPMAVMKSFSDNKETYDLIALDAKTLEKTRQIAIPGGVLGVGNDLLALKSDSEIAIFDIRKESIVRTFAPSRNLDDNPRWVFSPQQTYLAVAIGAGLEIYEIKSGEKSLGSERSLKSVMDVAFDGPDSVVACGDDGTTAETLLRWTLKEEGPSLGAVNPTPLLSEGKGFVPLRCLGERDGHSLWRGKYEDEEWIAWLDDELNIVKATQFKGYGNHYQGTLSPDGARLLIADNYRQDFTLIDTSTGDSIWQKTFSKREMTVAFASGGQLLVSSPGGDLRLIDPDRGDEEQLAPLDTEPFFGDVIDCLYLPDNEQALFLVGNDVIVYDGEAQKEIATFPAPEDIGGYNKDGNRLAVTADQKTLVVAAGDLHFWDIEAQAHMGILKPSDDRVQKIVFNEAQTRLLVVFHKGAEVFPIEFEA